MNNKRLEMVFLYVPLIVLASLALWYMATHPAPVAHAPTIAQPVASGPQKIVEHAQYYDIDATYPGSTALAVSVGAAADATAVAAMKGYEDETTAAFKQNGNFDKLTAEDIKMQGLDQGRKYALAITYEVKSSPVSVSYVFTDYEDTLGAHPNGYYHTFTFDSKTGAQLALSDLFVANTSYLQLLSTISRAQITKTLGNNVDVTYLNTGTTPEIANFQNFYLEGTNLVIIFPPYQVGPYAIGTQQVTIPLTELKASLKAEYLTQ